MCLWIPLVMFHFSYCNFQLWKNGFGFLFDFLSYLLISAFCWYIISLTFPVTSFSCLIINTVVLISFSRGSAITFFRDNVYWFIFLFWMGHTFLFLCMPCNFFVVENWTLNLILWSLWKSDSVPVPEFPGFCFCF